VKQHSLVRSFQVLTGILLGLAIVFWLVLRPSPDGSQEVSDYFLPEPIQAPDFTLTSHLGEEVGPDLLGAHLKLVFFGYTSCPDVCPLTLSHLTRTFRGMDEGGDRIQVLFITVDPERDTPERLAEYLSAFHPSFLGLTGTEEEIRGVAQAFGAYFAKVGEGEDYTVDHTARTFVLDAWGRIPLTFPVTATPEEMARDLGILLEGVE
jgi:protein SCO1/2